MAKGIEVGSGDVRNILRAYAQIIWGHPTTGARGFAVPMNPANAFQELAAILTVAQGGIAVDALEGWHEIGAASEPTFANSWVNHGFSNATAAFRKLPSGLVVIKGLVKAGVTTNPTTIFTLPAGYRPVGHMFFATTSNDLFGSLLVLLSGEVQFATGSNVWYSVSCSFFVGA